MTDYQQGLIDYITANSVMNREQAIIYCETNFTRWGMRMNRKINRRRLVQWWMMNSK